MRFRAEVMALCLSASSHTSPALITRCFVTKDIISGKNTVPLRSTGKQGCATGDILNLKYSFCKVFQREARCFCHHAD